MRRLLLFALLLSPPAAAQELSPELETLAAKDACTELLLTYGEGLDERDPLKIWPLFTQDGVWSADGRVTANSQAELRGIWEGLAANSRPTAGVHAISNIRFRREDAGTLVGSALVTQHRYDPAKPEAITSLAAMMLVDVSMRCVRTEDGWRFQRMELQSVSVADYVHGVG